ncbi:biopolymer transporter ExbD [Veronia nyctiphanis]|uniref:Biopolymer transporter ExbD n=1 Tax=Veronia nyctiphanis TaxID=1278244 RepID=A0A4Q0YUP4_9GAMM|nr:biopolymer transporter ExbD [Veronia nyctiphanis]RXJ74523.1 biopolymer transporter ExbD [Veronia nyctiphanis]
MIRQYQDNHKEMFSVDLTPLLDILFIVMVFLMLTASVQVKTMDVEIPATDEQSVLSTNNQDVITINILNAAPYWALDGRSIEQWKTFTQAVRESVKTHPEHKIIISPDKNASVESMLKVLAFLQQNNIDATNIVMEETKNGK